MAGDDLLSTSRPSSSIPDGGRLPARELLPGLQRIVTVPPALEQSLNVATIRMLNQVVTKRAAEQARRMGITTPIRRTRDGLGASRCRSWTWSPRTPSSPTSGPCEAAPARADPLHSGR